MLIDETVIDFTKLLTNQAYFTQKTFEAHTLLLASIQQQQAAAVAVSTQ